MKLEIELDINKIDYDSINKQIQEKIEALNISEMADIENRINTILDIKIRNAYNKYFDNNTYYADTYNGKKIINDLQKEKFIEVSRKIIDDIYKENKIEEIVAELFPRLFVQAMYDSLYDTMCNSIRSNNENTINNAISIVVNMLNNHGIQV